MVMAYCALGRSFGKLASLSLVVVLFTSGCVAIPMGETSPLAERRKPI